MKPKKLIVYYILELSMDPKIVGPRNLALEEIEYVIKTICAAVEGIQGIKSKCKKVRKHVA